MTSQTSVAVLIPLGKMFDALYEQTIRNCCQEIGFTCHRIPSEFSDESVRTQMLEQISHATFVIADITGRNPNILYQLGYAHALNKQVLLLTQHGENSPFDLKGHRIIVYAGSSAILRQELEHALKNWASSTGQLLYPSSVASGGGHDPDRQKFMSLFGSILEQHGHRHHGDIYLENPTTFVLVEQDMPLALVQDLARKAKGMGFRIKLL